MTRIALDTLTEITREPWLGEVVTGLASETQETVTLYLFVGSNDGGLSGGFDFGLSPAQDRLEGDVNGDGLLSKADADRIREAIIADERFNPLFDLNEDGIIDALDVNSVAGAVGRLAAGDADFAGRVGFSDFLVTSSCFGCVTG